MDKGDRVSPFSAHTSDPGTVPVNSSISPGYVEGPRSPIGAESDSGFAHRKAAEIEIILMNIDHFNRLLGGNLSQTTRDMVERLRDEFETALQRMRA